MTVAFFFFFFFPEDFFRQFLKKKRVPYKAIRNRHPDDKNIRYIITDIQNNSIVALFYEIEIQGNIGELSKRAVQDKIAGPKARIFIIYDVSLDIRISDNPVSGFLIYELDGNGNPNLLSADDFPTYDELCGKETTLHKKSFWKALRYDVIAGAIILSFSFYLSNYKNKNHKNNCCCTSSTIDMKIQTHSSDTTVTITGKDSLTNEKQY